MKQSLCVLSFRSVVCAALVAVGIVFSVSSLSAADAKGKPIFDGKSIEGWKINGGYASYKVEDGVIVGTTAVGSPNTFLCKGPFGDFELEFDTLCDNELNSGVQIRSQ